MNATIMRRARNRVATFSMMNIASNDNHLNKHNRKQIANNINDNADANHDDSKDSFNSTISSDDNNDLQLSAHSMLTSNRLTHDEIKLKHLPTINVNNHKEFSTAIMKNSKQTSDSLKINKYNNNTKNNASYNDNEIQQSNSKDKLLLTNNTTNNKKIKKTKKIQKIRPSCIGRCVSAKTIANNNLALAAAAAAKLNTFNLLREHSNRRFSNSSINRNDDDNSVDGKVNYIIFYI